MRIASSADAIYSAVVDEVLRYGTRKENRTHVDTVSAFDISYKIDLGRSGFPLLTTKFISWKNIVVEMLWFLSGSANTELLRRHGCRFWESWTDEFGNVGPVYGKQWRRWETLHTNPPRLYEAPPVVKSAPYEKVSGVGVYVRGDQEKLPFGEMLYSIWAEMLARCYDEKRKHFEWYGGRGVHVDSRWFEFRNFVEDVQKLEGWHLKRTFPDHYFLDKDFYNSNKYSVNDCLWLSERESHINTTVTKLIRATRPDGKELVTMDLTGLCSDYNLDRSTAHKVVRGEQPAHKGWKFKEEPFDELMRPRVRIFDQIADVVALLKTSPTSRRMVVSAWNPAEIHLMKLPPCHCQWIVNVQNYAPPCQACPIYNGSGYGPDRCSTCNGTGLRHDLAEQRLCLHLTQRSCDMALGVPYNIASYALLMHLLSRFSGIPVGIFGHALVDAHIYTAKPDGSMAEFDHVPGLKEQLQREPRQSPTLVIDPSITSLDDVPRLLELSTEELMQLFQLENYNPYPTINFKVAV